MSNIYLHFCRHHLLRGDLHGWRLSVHRRGRGRMQPCNHARCHKGARGACPTPLRSLLRARVLLLRLLRRHPCSRLRLHIVLLLLLLLLLVLMLLVLMHLSLLLLVLLVLLLPLPMPLVLLPLLFLRKYGFMQLAWGYSRQVWNRDGIRIHSIPRWHCSPLPDTTGRWQTWLIVHQQRCQAGGHRGPLAATADAQHLRKCLPRATDRAMMLWRTRQLRLLIARLACRRMHGEGLWGLLGGHIAMLRLKDMKAMKPLRFALLLWGLRLTALPALVQLHLKCLAVDGRRILLRQRLLCKLLVASEGA